MEEMKDIPYSTHLGESSFFPGMRIWGDANRVRGNLVTLSVWPGTYQNRKDLSSTLWHAAIEVV